MTITIKTTMVSRDACYLAVEDSPHLCTKNHGFVYKLLFTCRLVNTASFTVYFLIIFRGFAHVGIIKALEEAGMS